VAKEIRSAGGSAVAVATDVTHEKQIRAMVDTAVHEFDGIDIFHNNAALFARKERGNGEERPPGDGCPTGHRRPVQQRG
jgi:NAD(P)-dependent dehydrogenase (short-subunit alcohol dehydrogenase family)